MAVDKLVYTGITTLIKDEPGAIMRRVMEDGNLGDELYFSRKALRGASIGTVYSVETGEKENTWKLAGRGRKYDCQWHDKTAVAQWQLQARSLEVTEASAKAEKAAKKVPAAFELMKPLRDIYRSSLPNQKRAMEVLLLEYLRRGGA